MGAKQRANIRQDMVWHLPCVKGRPVSEINSELIPKETKEQSRN